LTQQQERSEGMETADHRAQAGVSAPLTPPRTGYIFISYARVDARYVDYVERMLTTYGYRVWMDRQQLGGGENWTVELERAIESSAALVLVLTRAALRSPMVRREYLQALAREIPVVIAMRRPMSSLPPELAHAQVIDMRKRSQAAAHLYFALSDRGVAPPAQTGQLDEMAGGALGPVILPVLGRRTPGDWQVYLAPGWSYWLRLLGRCTPILLYQCALTFIPAAWWSSTALQQARFWLFDELAPLFLLLGAYYAIPAFFYALVALGIIPREMVILTPDSCVASLLRVRRISLVAAAHRYMYQWAASASLRHDGWGSVLVAFEGVAGERVVLRLPWYWPKKNAIAQRIVADVAAFPRQPATEIRDATELSSAIGQPPAAVAEPGPQWYAFLAPAADRALVASVQAWLGSRGMHPVEMVWSQGRSRVLAPTARGAAYCRFALFIDTPAITQDARWRAILVDLQRRGVTVIPLRTQANPPAPSDWSSLQWVDFSKGVARDRGLLGLCDTLDRHGLLPTSSVAAPNQPFLDTDLALARAIYQRLPRGWTTFAGELAFQSTRFRRRRRRAASVIAIGGAASAIAVGTLAYFISVSQEVATVLIWTIALLVGAIDFQILSRRRARIELVRDQTIQERLVIAPEGLIFHFLIRLSDQMVRHTLLARFTADLPEREILHGSVVFGQVHAIEGRTDWGGAPTLRLTLHDGKIITLPLVALGSSAELAIEQAREAFRAYQTRRGPANGSPPIGDK